MFPEPPGLPPLEPAAKPTAVADGKALASCRLTLFGFSLAALAAPPTSNAIARITGSVEGIAETVPLFKPSPSVKVGCTVVKKVVDPSDPTLEPVNTGGGPVVVEGGGTGGYVVCGGGVGYVVGPADVVPPLVFWVVDELPPFVVTVEMTVVVMKVCVMYVVGALLILTVSPFPKRLTMEVADWNT